MAAWIVAARIVAAWIVAPLNEGSLVSPNAAPPNFDRIARAYRWLEYLSLGRALERMRGWHLVNGSFDNVQQALVLGDGDGRFTARLMRRNSGVRVTAIDASAKMLGLVAHRCVPHRDRLRLVRADARYSRFEPGADLVVTHFFLDCLTEAEVRELVAEVRSGLRPGARWVVSEFCERGLFTRGLIGALYLAFRLLTGLRVSRVPDYAEAMRACGFALDAAKEGLGGLLRTELWILTQGERSPVPQGSDAPPPAGRSGLCPP